MVKLIDYMENSENNIIQFDNLNKVFLTCLGTIVDTVGEEYNTWIKYYLENTDKLNEVSVLKKIQEVEATDYELATYSGEEFVKSNTCQVCGNKSLETSIYVYKDNIISVCNECNK